MANWLSSASNFVNNNSGLITAGLNAIVTASQNKKQRKFEQQEAEKQRLWNEQMAEQQNAWNLEQWNRTNEYNTAGAQVERLKEAGLNPLYYGVDGVAAQPMTAAQPMGYDRATAQPVENPISNFTDSLLKSKEIEKKDAEIANIKSQTKAIDAKLPYEVEELKNQVRNSGLDADGKEIINKYLDQQQQAELRVKESTADNLDASVQKSFAEISKMDYEKTTMFMNWLETQEKILTLQKNRELTDVQMKELVSLINLNNSNAKKIGLDVENYDEITVIGTASHTMRIGPFSVQEGEPITLAMKKAAQEHLDELKAKQKEKKKEGFTANSPYDGPIYD